MSEWQDIVRQRPRDVDEAILCLRKTLDYFHARHDYRAIFLRSYYIVTLEIHAAVHQLGGYREPFFFDPAWVSRLAGRFSCLYFQSLAAAERGGPGAARKFDHDQVHNLLVRCTPRIQEVLARDYGGGLLFLRGCLESLEQRVQACGSTAPGGGDSR